MGLRLIEIRQQAQVIKGCRRCSQTFDLHEYAFSSTRSNKGNASTTLYHISCARQINLTVAELWWNRLTKYKRKSLLIDMNLEPVDVEECYQLSYRKLPEEIKIQVDVRYYQR